MHLAPLIQDLAVILVVAGLMSLVFQRIRQPVVLGYILAGMLVGPHTLPFRLVTDVSGIQTWAELGVIFLMFSLGLEFSFRKLARVGAPAAIAAGTEVIFFIPVGYAIGRAFGWSFMDSIFLGAMLAISSTTIIIKALDELKLKTHRFAELIFGVLIVEDLIAILLLVGLTTVATTETISGVSLLNAATRLVLVVGGWFIVGYFVVPRFMRYVGRVGNNEMLTLVALGLCLMLVVFATRFHYSAALGAFIMGSILAESSVLHQIEGRMEPLRDLFGAIFFVSIGMLIDPRMVWEYKGIIAVLCVVTILGKILSTGFGALLSGQSFRNSVRVGFGLAQIGEFSFIIVGLGATLKATSEFLYPVAVAVSLVTTFTTPYLIRYSGPVADRIEAALPRRIQDLLQRYGTWNEERRLAMGKKRDFLVLAFRWVVNGLVVSVIFVLCAETLLPYLRSQLHFTNSAVRGLAWVAAVFLSAPFIWAMFSAFRDYFPEIAKQDRRFPRITLFSFRMLTVIWVATLSIEFFPARDVAISTAVALSIVIGLFYRRLEESYRWFEKRFLSTFEPSDGHLSGERDVARLAPWDAHLVRLRIHPNATFTGKSLAEAQLRQRYKVNVVVIQRGFDLIVAPRPAERLFPGDEILVLGTDQNIEIVRPFLEGPSASALHASNIAGYELKHVVFRENENFPRGTTIRNSGLREKYGVMVVGIEEDRKRVMNPDSDLTLNPGVVLWIVGSQEALTRLEKELLS